MNQREFDKLVAAINSASGDDGEYVRLGLSLWRKKPVVVFARRTETPFEIHGNSGFLACHSGDVHIVSVYEDAIGQPAYSDWPCELGKFIATYNGVPNYWAKNELEQKYMNAGYSPVVKTGTQWMIQIRTDELDDYLLVTTEECLAGDQQKIFDGDYLSVGVDGEMWPIEKANIGKYEMV